MKSYDNEKKLVESLLNNKSNISSIQNYIKENYSVDSIYDKEISTLYVWGEKCNEAKTYIKENICDELLDIELSKPNYDIVNEAEAEKVFVIYFDDGIINTAKLTLFMSVQSRIALWCIGGQIVIVYTV